MVTGKTKSAGFQVGVRKTLEIERNKLWTWLTDPSGFRYFIGEKIQNEVNPKTVGVTGNGLEYRVTTFQPGSHIRRRWKLPEWNDHSILQVRIIDAGSNRTTLAIHQEKLAGKKEREFMLSYWKSVMTDIEAGIPGY